MQQATDFLQESQSLQGVIAGLSVDDLARVTQFKNWRIADVIGHLHFWNQAALLSLTDTAAFTELLAPLMPHLQAGGTLRDFEKQHLAALTDDALVAAWVDTFEATGAAYAAADPSQRVAWAGPSMSARSAISARQMETWAHGQAVFDCLGLHRIDADRIRNIVTLGINTYAWSFQVRGEAAPGPMPALSLVAPSGALWQFGENNPDERIEGTAVEFCQVVTQTRHVADTALRVRGETAVQWMQKAQCFAGGPSSPPAPGSRYRAE